MADLAMLGRRSKRRLREIAATVAIGAASSSERTVSRGLRARGIETIANVRIGLYTFDHQVAGTNVLIEDDSERFHGGAAFIKDRWKANAALKAGSLVLRYTDACIKQAPGAVFDDIEQALTMARRAPRGRLKLRPVWEWHPALRHPGSPERRHQRFMVEA